MVSGIELLDFPTNLATQLGIPVFAGEILASIIFLMFPLLPTLIWARGRNNIAVMIVGLSTLGFCVALGWFPIWMFAILCVLIALLYAKSVLGIFGGD